MARGAVRTGEPLWQSPKLLYPIAVVMFLVEAACCLLLGWVGPAALDEATTVQFGNTTYTSFSTDSALGATVTSLISVATPAGIIGVIALLMGKRRGPAWGIAYFLGLPPLGLGVGAMLSYAHNDRFELLPVILAVVGFFVVLMHPVAELRYLCFVRSQERTRANGITTTALVRRTTIVTHDSINYWMVWLEYQDQQGRTFNIRHRLPSSYPGMPQVNQAFTIIYDPRHPGRRSSVVVSDHSAKVDRFSGSQRATPAARNATRPDRPATGQSTKFVHWKGRG